MHVVVEDDDPDHDSQAERHRLLAGEAAAVLPEETELRQRRRDRARTASARCSRRFQHDFTHGRHGAEAVRGVLDGQVLVLPHTRTQKESERARTHTETPPRPSPASPPIQTWLYRRLTSSAWAWRRRRTERCGWPARY